MTTHLTSPTPASPRPALPPGAVEAVVQVGEAETRYHRAGCGPHLLLLGIGETDGALFAALAARFRVTAPVRPGREDGDGSAAAWLRGVVDGLGLARFAVVAEGGMAVAALELTRSDPDRVERVAVVHRHEPGREREEAALGALAGDSDLPLLIVRTGGDGDPPGDRERIAGEILRFLDVGAGGG